jgi:hypothetical protein
MHLADGGVNRNIHATQTRFDQALGFDLVNECAVGRHRHADAKSRGVFHQIRQLWSEHRLAT